MEVNTTIIVGLSSEDLSHFSETSSDEADQNYRSTLFKPMLTTEASYDS